MAKEKVTRISVSIDKETEEIFALAKVAGISISGLIRKSVSKYFYGLLEEKAVEKKAEIEKVREELRFLNELLKERKS